MDNNVVKIYFDSKTQWVKEQFIDKKTSRRLLKCLGYTYIANN